MDPSPLCGYDTYFMDGSPASFDATRSFATLTAADLDGDAAHRLDVVGIDRLVLRRAFHTGDRVLATADLLTSDVRQQRLLLGDVTGDGRPDVVLEYGDSLSALRSCSTALRDIGLADLDGDGALDVLAILGGEPWDIVFLFGAGDGTFDSRRSVPAEQAQALLVDDDRRGDGIPDVVLVMSGAFVGPDHVRGRVGKR